MQVKIFHQLKLLFQGVRELHHILIFSLEGKQDGIMYLHYWVEVTMLFYNLFLLFLNLQFFHSTKLDSNKHENDLKIRRYLLGLRLIAYE